MGTKSRAERDELRRKLKSEWTLMWRERFDDRVRAEGVVVRDYVLLFMDRGLVIFASRNAKNINFSEIVDLWASRGAVYSPEPSVGGLGKFIKTELKYGAHSRARAHSGAKAHDNCSPRTREEGNRQLRKGGRGWLHAR